MALREIGRQGRIYVVKESPYGTHPTHASTDAMRHIQFLASADPTNKRNSAEKRFSPEHSVRFLGRKTAALRQLSALVRPSGTINTLPEAAEILEAAFGAQRSVVLSTTVASGGAVGGATLTSATGTAAHDFALITCPDGKKRARRLTAADTGTGVVAWAPNLPTGQQPANGAAVKTGVSWRLTQGNAIALSICHYLTKTDGSTAGLSRWLSGVGIDRFALQFDANEEPQFTASGPAKDLVTGGTVPAKPAAFTTVGGNPPSGLTGELLVGNTAYDFLRLQVELTNNLVVRNDEYGYDSARALYRRGEVSVSVSLDARSEDEAVLYDLAEAGTDAGIFLQTGFTEGNIIAISLPRVETKVPDTDDPDEEVNWPFRGMALASADEMYDSIFVALL